jgi:ATP synthase F1 delta subunit
LDEMAPSSTVFSDAATAKLRAASRQSVITVVEQFDEAVAGLDGDALTKLSDDLASTVKLLRREPVLGRHLADPSADSASRVQLVERLLSGKVSDSALDILKTAVSQRWSSSSDLTRGIQHIARLALLVRAEADGQIEDVEEQLFRFSRILDSETQLITLLSDYTSPLDGRISLLNNVLHRRASKNTADLLRQSIELLHGERADDAVRELANLAVSRRGEVVAHVRAASELSDAQRNRLTELLNRIYGHPVSLQLDIDPSLLGGLTISVGDEVIDGSLSSKLASAENRLPE